MVSLRHLILITWLLCINLLLLILHSWWLTWHSYVLSWHLCWYISILHSHLLWCHLRLTHVIILCSLFYNCMSNCVTWVNHFNFYFTRLFDNIICIIVILIFLFSAETITNKADNNQKYYTANNTTYQTTKIS